MIPYIIGTLIALIAIPLMAGLIIFILPKGLRGAVALAATIVNCYAAFCLYKINFILNLPWAGCGIDFSLRLYHFGNFIVCAAAFFSLLVVLYSLNFLKGKANAKQFYAYLLISLAFVNGSVLANNLVVLLFFWEGLLLTLFGLIAIGGRQSFKTATKALIIVGACDLCLLAGIALTIYIARTPVISDIHLIINSPLAGLAFVLMVIGAISKAGSMPFHTWIPDAAQDAPLPFMAFFPAAIEKLLGIYLLTRITLDLFQLNAHSFLSVLLMAIGAITIILAVMMALIQKDYKRLLSYHAISQVGYMILGIGTCLPVGIIGGLFHMLNNAVYKCCLFLTGGAVEQATGTTDLAKLGGLYSRMPVTFICYAITAASISGVPPFNGFFSKELIYDAALERGLIFYIAAVAGSFFTAASFLKLGHAAFLDRARQEYKGIKEAPLSMLIPMIVLAAACILLGIFNRLPINNIFKPVLGTRGDELHLAANPLLILISVVVLTGAIIHHLLAAKIKASGLKAADHIHHAPVLSNIYDWAEKKYFDPYVLGMKFIDAVANILWRIDKGVDWFYGSFTVNVAEACSRTIRRLHTGYYGTYIIWSLVGACLVIWVVL